MKKFGILIVFLLTAPPVLAQDIAAGKVAYGSCINCHQVGEEAERTLGPILSGIIGRVAGTDPGARYSKSLVAAGEAGLVWTEDLIADFLGDPEKFLKAWTGDSNALSYMPYKIWNEQRRLDLAAYLATL